MGPHALIFKLFVLTIFLSFLWAVRTIEAAFAPDKKLLEASAAAALTASQIDQTEE